MVDRTEYSPRTDGSLRRAFVPRSQEGAKANRPGGSARLKRERPQPDLLDESPVDGARRGVRSWHLVLPVVLWITVMHPVMTIGGLAILGMILCGALMIVGEERVMHHLTRLFGAIHRRNPKRAARLYAGLDVFACQWDALLDRFPEGAVDAFYLPDLSVLDHAAHRASHPGVSNPACDAKKRAA